MTEAPFPAQRIDLGRIDRAKADLTLGALPEAEAERLGVVFAGIEPWSKYPYPASDLARYFASKESGAPRFAAALDGEICGVLGLRLNWLRGPYIQFLGVLPSHQRLGLGAALLRYVEQQAQSIRERNVFVCVSDFNADAIRFYERNAFKRVAAIDGLVRDARTEILMRKQLGNWFPNIPAER